MSKIRNKGELKNIADQVSKGRRDNEAARIVWHLCSCFLEGKHEVRYNSSSNELWAGFPTDREKSPVVNKTLAKFRTAKAALQVGMPGIGVQPTLGVFDDMTKAMACQHYLQAQWSAQKMHMVVGELIDRLLAHGNAALYSYWSKEKGRPCTEIIPAKQLVFEEAVESPEESRWVGIIRYIHKREAYKKWPELKEEHQRQYEDMADPSLSGLRQLPPDRLETCYVFWRNGDYAVIVDGMVVSSGNMGFKGVPLSFIRFTKIPDRLWGKGIVEPMMNLNLQYNRRRSQQMVNGDLMANPFWANPRGNGLKKKDFTSRVGGVLEYSMHVGAPKQLQPLPLPPQVAEDIDRLDAEMQDVAGIHRASMGGRVPGVSSGRALLAQAEQDSTNLSPAMENIADGLSDWGKVQLQLAKQNLKEQRAIRAYGSTGRIIHRKVSSTDFFDDPEVEIESSTLFRRTAEAKEARAMGLLQAGLADPKEVRASLRLDVDPLRRTEAMLDYVHAEDMLEAAKLVGPKRVENPDGSVTLEPSDIETVEVFANDNLEAIVEVFGQFIKTPEYYELDAEAQDYIRDVVVEVSAFMANPAPTGMPYGQIYPKQGASVAPQQTSPMMPNAGPRMQEAAVGQQQAAANISRDAGEAAGQNMGGGYVG